MIKLSVVIPCFNEEGNIPVILNNFEKIIHRDDIEIIFVDNGSTDNTYSLLKKIIPKYKFAKFERIKVNIGYGHGILFGLKKAKGRYLGWTHADMQTSPKDVLKGLEIIEKNKKFNRIYVKGVREGRSIPDQFFSIGMAIIESILLRKIFWDINAQPNIFSRDLVDIFNKGPNDFSFDLYYYFIALKYNYKIIRFNVKFKDRLFGQSKWNVNWKSKFKFIFRTLIFTFHLKHFLKKNNFL